jgi:diapolycopene oxygenase
VARRALVVGAGLGGLSAAACLSAAGWEVEVHEAAAGPGGKAGLSVREGYAFDTGPSLLTLTEVFDELFSRCGENRSEHLSFLPLPRITAHFWDDGTVVRTSSEPGVLARELSASLGEDPAAVEAYLARAERVWDIAAPLFLRRSLHEADTYLSREGVRGILSLGRIGALGTMHGLHVRSFRRPRTVQLFDRLATYNGSSPFSTPGTLSIIAHAEYGKGGYAVRGGIRAVPREIEALARRRGASFHYGSPVERILVEGGRARGLGLRGGRERRADLVVCNADAGLAYERLLPGLHEDPLARRYRRLEPSSSGLVFLWGVGASFPELLVNNIFFSDDYRAEFAALFRDLRCPDDPTVYVNITSKVDPPDAPEGCENWFVLVNAPRDAGQDWAAETARVRRAALGRLSRVLGRDIGALVQTEEVLAPPDIRERTGSSHGSLYGISSNGRLAAFLRHPNRHPRVGGLYFCGGSVHPGGGMPLVLRSGMICADLIGRHEGRGGS